VYNSCGEVLDELSVVLAGCFPTEIEASSSRTASFTVSLSYEASDGLPAAESPTA
jgi:hypothetical protein